MSLAAALEWKYGAIANTRQMENGDMVITAWRHPAEPQPTDIPALMAQYNARDIEDEAAGELLNGREKLVFVILFEMENRLRTVESKPQITKRQFRKAIASRLK